MRFFQQRLSVSLSRQFQNIYILCLRTTEQLAARYLLNEGGLDSFVGSSHRFGSVLALKTPYCKVTSAHVLEMVDEQ